MHLGDAVALLVDGDDVPGVGADDIQGAIDYADAADDRRGRLHVRAGIVVGQGDGDGVDAAAGVDMAAAERAGAVALQDGRRRGVAVSPIDDRHVRVEGAHVRERSGERDRLVLHRRAAVLRAVLQSGDHRCHVLDPRVDRG